MIRDFRERKVHPKSRVGAIGDIHGQYALMKQMIGCLKSSDVLGGGDLVFLGDLISRGPDPASCFLHACDLMFNGSDDFRSVRVLMGNHEQMFFSPLADDRFEFRAPYWPHAAMTNHWMYGLDECTVPSVARYMASHSEYGDLIGHDRCLDIIEKWLDYSVRCFLNRKKPKKSRSPLFVFNGNILFVHAGIDTGSPDPFRRFRSYNPLDIRSRKLKLSMNWIRKPFLDDMARGYVPKLNSKDIFVVHGHTQFKTRNRDGIIDLKPEGYRLGLDSGAYETGCLSAGVFENNLVRIVQIDTGAPFVE